MPKRFLLDWQMDSSSPQLSHVPGRSRNRSGPITCIVDRVTCDGGVDCPARRMGALRPVECQLIRSHLQTALCDAARHQSLQHAHSTIAEGLWLRYHVAGLPPSSINRQTFCLRGSRGAESTPRTTFGILSSCKYSSRLCRHSCIYFGHYEQQSRD